MLRSNVFERVDTEADRIRAGTYNIVMGLVLCWGFLVNWLLVTSINPATLLRIPPELWLLAFFASCFFGIYLFNNFVDPVTSFAGYNFVVVPFGLALNLLLNRSHPGLVVQTIQMTGGVTLIMMLFGTLFPRFFQSIYAGLGVALLACMALAVLNLISLQRDPVWLDVAVAAVFCGYIGYDWGRANRIPKTIDNAIDSAAAIYMDIINLFVRMLRAKGRR